MANKPKNKGTAYETEIARLADQRQWLAATRSANNSPGRDVDIRLADGTVIPVECKNRANLNVHALAKEVQDKQPDTPPIVIWRRTQRKNGNARATRDGPDIAAIPVPMLLDLLEAWSATREPTNMYDSERMVQAWTPLEDRYPNLGQ